MVDSVDLSSDDWLSLARQALEESAAYSAGIENRPITPRMTRNEMVVRLREPLPMAGSSEETILETIRSVITPGIRHNGHPRFFGYVASPAYPTAVAGSLLTSTWNANVTAWRSAPAAVELEHLVIDWIKEMVGFGQEAMGLFVSGGSMANFAAIAAARSRAFPFANEKGAAEVAARGRIYASEEVHFSVLKAAAMLGVGSENVRLIATDEAQCMDVSALDRAIAADVKAGLSPVCVVATMGTVSTGALDPLEQIAAVTKRYGAWLHVDGCYGGFAAMAPSVKASFASLTEADSMALDPHKWLFVPIDCGCVLYRDAESAKRAFAHDADYTRPVGLADAEAFAFWDYGPELSRPFRAFNVWLQIKSAGIARLSAAIESNIQCAHYLEQLVRDSSDFEMVSPVQLSICCFRYVPPGYSGDLDALNEAIMIELQRQGSSYVSNARVGGKFALRACVVNFRTKEDHVARLLDDVRVAASAVLRA